MKISEVKQLHESSGHSLEGSFTPDLVFSKYWLMQELARVQPVISTMYVLGSWYGNLSLYITRYGVPQVQRMINVDTNSEFQQTGQQLLDLMGGGPVDFMDKDANQLDYRKLDRNAVVVNTSVTDIAGRKWFDNIPIGTRVVLQTRDQDANSDYESVNDMINRFPMSQVLYSGEMALRDPETQYRRFMVIGVK